MRKTRVSPPNRCYHLISRVAHRAFFLDNDEKPRLVDLIRRVTAMRLNSYCGNLLWQSSLQNLGKGEPRPVPWTEFGGGKTPPIGSPAPFVK